MTAPVTIQRVMANSARMRVLMRTMRHPGTNGWTSEWGTNAHREIAGCPPPA